MLTPANSHIDGWEVPVANCDTCGNPLKDHWRGRACLKAPQETRLYILKSGKWKLQETFTGEPGGREFAIERAAIWRAHGWQVKLTPEVA